VEKYLGKKPTREPGTPGGMPMGPTSTGGVTPASF
jgi:hypothetical protein